VNNQIRILIADDHPIFRQGLRVVIEKEPGFVIVDEAEDGASALALIETLRPDVAVLDINMPNLTGFQIARAVRDKRIGVKIIILTMHKDERMFDEAMELEVKGYVLKESAMLELGASIRTVAAGSSYISPPLSGFLLNRHRNAAALAEQMPGLNTLTPTERRVLKLLAECKTSKEIGEELHIDFRTVNNHRTNICQKLNIQGTHSLLKFALEHKGDIN
jgi:DNA-binding NarL/FixJ family response regulator